MKILFSIFDIDFIRRRKRLAAWFDENYYLERYPDIRSWRDGAFNHYLLHGSREGRSPNMFFDAEWYRRVNVDVPEDLDPLDHYVRLGEAEGRWPHPLFDPSWYLQINSDVAEAGISPLRHFMGFGLREGREFSPLLSGKWYRDRYHDSVADDLHPIVHFLTEGKSGAFDPGPHFSSQWYLEDNPDVRNSGAHPYLHFLGHGQSEGRLPLPYLSGRHGTTEQERNTPFDVSNLAEFISHADYEPRLVKGVFSFDLDPNQFKLVSFDVWNTLIHRECHPNEIKLQSARCLQLVAGQYLNPKFSALRELYLARIEAENRSAQNGDHEYRFVDAINIWLSETLLPSTNENDLARIGKILLDHEFSAELSCTHRDDLNSDRIERMTVPRLFASDFYMSSQFVAALLKAHNIGGSWAAQYCSSDTYESKRSGKLFQRIISDFNIDPKDILHIGDNLHSDVVAAQALGIATYHYEPNSEIERLNWYEYAMASFLNNDLAPHHRRILAILENACSEVTPNKSALEVELFRLGICIAPIAFSFCLSVLEDAIKEGSDKVFFFSREGIFLKKVYDAIVDEDPYKMDYPLGSILEVSRRATFAASLDSFSVADLMRLWSMYHQQSPRGLASSLNLDESIVRRVAERHGIPFDQKVPEPWENSAFKTMMNDQELLGHAEACIALQKDALIGYLKQQGVLSTSGLPITVVDIGWRGTIQDNLAKVVSCPVRGHYLALFKFLNRQAANSVKTGWLGDANIQGTPGIPDQVAPLEMIFNGEGGSVTGYELQQGNYAALKELMPGEENVVKTIGYLQAGMLAAVPLLARYVSLHGLSAEQLRPLAREMTLGVIKSPPRVLSDLFAELEHNETFGTGDYEAVGGVDVWNRLRPDLPGREVHYELENWLKSVRWPEGAIRQTRVLEWWKRAPEKIRATAPIAIAKIYSPSIVRVMGHRLAIYAPAALRASGGHRTIFNMTRNLAQIGFQPYIFTDGIGDGVGVVEEYLAGTSARIHTSWNHSIQSTVAFATIAHSAKFVSSAVDAPHKFYLVQDAEALFNPVGDAYVTAENSYAQGLSHITIGNWLTHVIKNQYDAPAFPAGLGVDTDTYHLAADFARENAVCMLYQPEKPRRGNALALEALRLVQKEIPDLKIYLYGSDERIETPFSAEQLGVITKLSELNELYNRCRAGICISLSNPSRIPFEMMAAGCIPVDLYRYNNLFDYDSNTAMLTYQNPESVALGLRLALTKNQDTTTSRGLADVARRRTLKWENDAIVGHVLSRLNDTADLDGDVVRRSYISPPIIAPTDAGPGAVSFCAWQRKQADERRES